MSRRRVSRTRVVAMAPARRNQQEQPYNVLLCEELEQLGWTVIEALPSWLFRPWRAGVVHFHWPEYLFRRRFGWVMLLWLPVAFAVHRALGGRVVQTVHNVQPHGGVHSRVESLGLALVDRVTDRIVVHSQAVLRSVEVERPVLRSCTASVLPHPIYPFVVRDRAREEVRGRLGVGLDEVLYLHFGLLRRYKGTVDLALAWSDAAPAGAHLHLAGRPDEDVSAELSTIEQSVSGLTMDLRLLPIQELHDTIVAADVIVLPYRAVSTSGSAALALAGARPVVAPSVEPMRELQDLVGESWVMLYDGELSAGVLERAADHARAVRAAGAPDGLPGFGDLAAAMADVYR